MDAKPILGPRALAALLGLSALCGLSAAAPAAADDVPPPLEAETSDVAVMPDPAPHRVLLLDVFGGGEARILDGDSGKILGGVSAASLSNVAVGPGQKQIYVAESIWTKGNRGDRQDMVTVYDGKTLNLKTEIAIPGRVFMGPRMQNFALSAGAARGYVYNMTPGSSVVVVDLKADKVERTVELPGCALVFPFGDDGFSSLCGDGSLATVTLGADGPALTRSKPFFNAEADPVFENSPTDRTTGTTLFVTYTGLVHRVTLGATPTFEAPWSLLEAAGFPAPSTSDRDLAWRPGGEQALTYHRASGRLYVLMHPGGHWTHKDAGTEVWCFDVAKHALIKRFKLDKPLDAIAVTQDAEPVLFGVGAENVFYVLKPDSGEVVKTVKRVGGMIYDPAA
ncbi:amine dehydrogenase large subunit [Phenylobacterium sp.]|uniref:amine dehydrogenase large subunit n=1 Tax=Phenylobacterium sp. TaxID=1871053 RepID=UPI0025E7813F|nr:amine dehydrogenase large subunit [Phenylobacterium sp.]